MTQIKVNYENEVLLAILKKDMHGRELAKALETSLTRIQSILNELRSYNILDYRVEGKNHIYFIKKNLIAKAFVLNSENYKLAKLLVKYPFLEPLLKEVMQKCPEQMIILFGSYAKFIPKKESDIDLYLDLTDKKVKEAVHSINEKFSVKTGKFNKEDLLIQEIVRNHVIINGGEAFYEKLGFFK
ncbi:nucleotidyltransferase domain-containing protein [Candidatus Woesearchaeota archaeon]|nr:nucleotidyltransferase domain-containing protein [Candidatus Woesearchaeota archaeon]